MVRGLAGRVIGIGRSQHSLDAALRTGAVTDTSLDPAAAAEADFVLVATSVASIPTLLDAVDAAVRPGTLLTDAGSTKGSIVSAWERKRVRRRGRFVGSHPLAGSHRRGPEAADADLFNGRVVVVTPAAATPQASPGARPMPSRGATNSPAMRQRLNRIGAAAAAAKRSSPFSPPERSATTQISSR
jgi:prephenate dehydrogenase